MARTPDPRFVRWMGSARKDLRSLPKAVRCRFAYAIYMAQLGNKHPNAKPMRGFGGAGVLEVVEDLERETFRAVYTVRFEDVVYVLHAFQKKSKRGAETDQTDIDLIRARLKRAEADHERGFE